MHNHLPESLAAKQEINILQQQIIDLQREVIGYLQQQHGEAYDLYEMYLDAAQLPDPEEEAHYEAQMQEEEEEEEEEHQQEEEQGQMDEQMQGEWLEEEDEQESKDCFRLQMQMEEELQREIGLMREEEEHWMESQSEALMQVNSNEKMIEEARVQEQEEPSDIDKEQSFQHLVELEWQLYHEQENNGEL